jgi:hypothetical protein
MEADNDENEDEIEETKDTDLLLHEEGGHVSSLEEMIEDPYEPKGHKKMTRTLTLMSSVSFVVGSMIGSGKSLFEST